MRCPSFARFCEHNRKVRFSSCYDAETGFVFLSWWCSFKKIYKIPINLVYQYGSVESTVGPRSISLDTYSKYGVFNKFSKTEHPSKKVGLVWLSLVSSVWHLQAEEKVGGAQCCVITPHTAVSSCFTFYSCKENKNLLLIPSAFCARSSSWYTFRGVVTANALMSFNHCFCGNLAYIFFYSMK